MKPLRNIARHRYPEVYKMTNSLTRYDSTSHRGVTPVLFQYNARPEIVSAVLGNDNYAFDNIGNRATEAVAIANPERRIIQQTT